MSEHAISIEVNGVARHSTVPARLLLVHYLRETLGLTGTHVGCDTTSCGACTVLLDRRPVKSCTMFAVQADQGSVMTIEGLARDGRPHPLQEAFGREYGLQCGFCTPGMIMAAVPLVEGAEPISKDGIRTAISGNLCRCTGYVDIIRSIELAATIARGDRHDQDEEDRSDRGRLAPAAAGPVERQGGDR
jgi:carbon-monoxide dehydrogenase small subunit